MYSHHHRHLRSTLRHLRPIILPAALATLALSASTYLLLALIRTPVKPVFHRELFGTWQYSGNIPGVMDTKLAVSADSATVSVARGSSSLEFAIPLAKAQLSAAGDTTTYTVPHSPLTLEYKLGENGLKENIILAAKPTSTELPVTVDLTNLTAKVTPAGLPVFYDNKGVYQFHFVAPYAEDAKGVVTHNLRYQLVPISAGPLPLDRLFNKTSNGSTHKTLLGSALPIPSSYSPTPTTYRLILTLDPAWLSAKDRAYPVTIDPTVVHSTSSQFAAGTENRVTDTGSPNLTTYYQELPADESTIGLWHLNEASGTSVADSSGNGNTGTVTGTTINTATPILGSAARTFADNTTDHIVTTKNIGSGPITFSLWYKRSGAPAQVEAIMENDTGTAGQIFIGLWINTNGTAYFQKTNNNTANLSSTSSVTVVTDGNWHHIAGELDGTNYYIYVDGKLEGYNGAGSATALTLTPILIGSDHNSVNGYYRSCGCSLDDVAAYNRLLSSEEVRLIAQRRPYGVYTSPLVDFTVPVASWNSLSWSELGVATGDGETLSNSTSLIAQWNFNETSGTTASVAAGSCGTSCNGTLTNFASTASQDQAAGTGWTAANARWPASSPAALMFDGTNDYTICTDATCGGTTQLDYPGSGSWSLGAWVKTSSAASQTILGKSNNTVTADNDNSYLLFLNGGNAFIYVTNTAGSWDASRSSFQKINDGNWHYIVGVYTPSTNLDIYVDGVLSNGTLTGAIPATIRNSGSAFLIGSRLQNTSTTPTILQPFSGVIDVATVYARALTASEILSNYNSTNLEFQTRVGASADPNDGTWEAWKPATSETQIDSLDTIDKWSVDNYQNSLSTINLNGNLTATPGGTGNDGACVMNNGTITLDSTIGSTACVGSARTTAYAVNFTDTALEATGDTSITVSSTPTGLAAGDEFLIVNLQGSSTNYNTVGQYETHVISSISTNTLNFTDYPLKNTYDGTTQKIMVQRIPNFTNVTVCGGNTGSGCTAAATATATAWNGTKGGVFALRASGALVVNSGGTVTTNSLGYRGGAGRTCQTAGCTGYQGESYGGVGGLSTAANLGAGGGGYYPGGSNSVGLGGHAGYGSVGNIAGCEPSCTARGAQGVTYGNQLGLFLGSGGGGDTFYGNTGGIGGGAIYLGTPTLTNNGTISTNGQHPAVSPGYSGDGSGGTIILSVGTASLGSTTTTASAIANGDGRISVFYTSSISGTTNPYLYSQKNQTGPMLEGTGSEQLKTGELQADSATVGLWHLNEIDSSGAFLTDASNNGNNATPTGTTLANGIVGKARSFATGDYISHPTTGISPAAITVEMWINPSWNGNDGAVHGLWQNNITYSDEANSVSLFKYSSNLLYWRVMSPAAGYQDCTVDVSNTFRSGQWTHIAAEYSAAGSFVYFNGVLACSTTIPSLPNAVPTGGSTARIGYGWQTTFGNGIIDEVKVSNTPRLAEELAEDYRMGRDHRIDKTISSTDISAKQRLAFQVAADRPGTYLEAMVGNNAYANYEPDGNTVGLWHLDEQSGSGAYLKDLSGRGNNGTPAGTTFVQGKIGKARYFNGTASDYINLGLPSSLQITTNVTYEAWFQASNWGATYPFIFGESNNANDGVFILGNASSASMYAQYQIGGTYHQLFFNNPDIRGDGKWHHIATTYDGTTIKNYFDGMLTNSVAQTGNITYGGNIWIGARYTGGNTNNWLGSIDEARISNIARSAADIRSAFEYGKRAHEVTIDFAANLLTTIPTNTYKSFNMDATSYGFTNAGSNLYPGDKVIVHENYNGTDYYAQGTVDTVTTSGAVTVASWDSSSTFPPNGFAPNSNLFKWQREYMDLSGVLPSQRSGVTRLTLRLTNGSEGRSIWLDDLESVGSYLTTPGGSTITSSTGYRYFQYRTIMSSSDYNVSPSLTSATIDYVGNSAPGTPTLDAPTNAATNQSVYPVLKTTATDADGNTIEYKIVICTDSGMTTGCQTFDQTASSAGWSSSSYASGVQGVYTVQTALAGNTTYYWKSSAIDPTGSNTWGATQGSANSFTTSHIPATPSLDLPVNGGSASTLVALKTTATDADADYLRYKIVLCTNSIMTIGCQTFDQTSSQTGWSGQNAQTSTAYTSGTQAVYTIQSALTPSTTYFWQSYAIDPGGSGAWSATQTTPNSFITNLPATPTLVTPGNGDSSVGLLPTLSLVALDNSGNYLRYKILMCTNVGMSVGCQTFDQTISQTGWSGQNAQTSTAYTSGTTALYTIQSALVAGTTYYWQGYSIAPGGANAWSSPSNQFSFSTSSAPTAATGCVIHESRTDASLQIAWGNNAINNTGYEIRRAVDGGAFSVLATGLSPTATSYTDSSLTEGHAYQYEVAPYYSGPTYGPWCLTAKLDVSRGNFNFSNINFH